jgi:hypothetical protein
MAKPIPLKPVKPTLLKPVKPTLLKPTPPDAIDFESLWEDPKLGDGITTSFQSSVPVDKPLTFFRTHPDLSYRRRTTIYTHKIQGVIGEQHYIVAPPMRGLIEEARKCSLVCVIYRDGSVRLWVIKSPRKDEKDNAAWLDARAAAKIALEHWIRIVWISGAYQTRYAEKGYAPDPDWSKVPPWDDLIEQGFGERGIIKNKSHPIYRELAGLATEKPPSDGLDGDDF